MRVQVGDGEAKDDSTDISTQAHPTGVAYRTDAHNLLAKHDLRLFSSESGRVRAGQSVAGMQLVAGPRAWR